MDRRNPAVTNSPKVWKPCVQDMGEAVGGCTPSAFSLEWSSFLTSISQHIDQLLSTALPIELHPAIPYLSPYLLASFGSFLRMDYGSGHETCFAIFLLCLSLIRFFTSEQDEERQIVLLLFVRYLRLCWRLQDVYNLEPAGSHGVWGLDDYSFLGYIFGSGQLRGGYSSPELTPAQLRSIAQTKRRYQYQRYYTRRSLLPIFTSCRSCGSMGSSTAPSMNILHNFIRLQWVCRTGGR